MGVLNLKLAELATKRIEVGFVGENLHNQVRIDSTVMFNSYPNAIPSMAITIPTGESYPVFTTREGNEIVWDIQRSALVVDGDGEIQLTFTDGEMVAKTYKCKIRIKKSIIPDGESPTIIEDWIEQANTVLNGIPETINSALNEAKQSGEFNGATFVPEVNNGVLSWSNDAGLENPEPVDFSNEFASKDEIPTKVSDLDNDSNFLTQETDPTVPSWAKQPNKPSYTPQEIGAMPANTPIPQNISDLNNDSNFYEKPQTGIPLEDLSEDVMQAIRDSSDLAPVASSGDYNDLINKPEIPSKISDLQNDSNFLTQETDPTVPSWAKQPAKPSYTAQEVGALPSDTVIPDPTSIIDDTAGDGDTSKVWSADKAEEEVEKKYEKPQNGIPIEDLDSSLKNLVDTIDKRVFATRKTINTDEYHHDLYHNHTGMIDIKDGLKDAPVEFNIALPLKTTNLEDSNLPYVRSFEKRTNVTLRQYNTENIFDSDLFLNEDGEELLGVTINVLDDGRITFTGQLTPDPEIGDTIVLSSEYFILPSGFYNIGIKGAIYGWPIPCGFELVKSNGDIIVYSSSQGQSFSLEEDTECSFHILYASSMDYREVVPWIVSYDVEDSSSFDSFNTDSERISKSNLVNEININIPQEYNFYAGYLTSDGKLHKTMACIDSYNGESINHGWISNMEEDTDDNSPTIGSTVIYPLTNEITYDIQSINIKTENCYNNFLVYDNSKFSLLSYYVDLSSIIDSCVLNENGLIKNSLTIGYRGSYNNDPIGDKSICVGEGNVSSGLASGTFGSYNKVYGYCDYGAGYNNEIQRNYSYCFALGEYNKIGYESNQSTEHLIDFYGGNTNIALGEDNYIVGSYNIALCYDNAVAGNYNIVGGSYNFGNGYYSTVFGDNNISTYPDYGDHYIHNFVAGHYNRSIGRYNTVFGSNNNIYGENTIALGSYLESYLDGVLILGEYNAINEPIDKENYTEWQPNTYYQYRQKVYKDCEYPRSYWSTSTVRLYFTRASAGTDYSEFNYWNWNIVKSDYIEIFGNGEAGTRSNARTLDRNGNEWLAGGLTLNTGSLTIGGSYGTRATGNMAIAAGFGSTASGGLSVVVGSGSRSTESCAVSIGSGVLNEGYSSIVVGSGNENHGHDSINIGGGNKSRGCYSATFGECLRNVGCSSLVFGQYNIPDEAENFEEWQPNHSYEVEDYVKVTIVPDPEHDSENYPIIYKCIENNNDSTFDPEKWHEESYKNLVYAEIVGGGSGVSDKKNIRTLDWEGNQRLAGSLRLYCNIYHLNGYNVPVEYGDSSSAHKGFAFGEECVASGAYNTVFGYYNNSYNDREFVFGRYNISPNERITLTTSNVNEWQPNREYKNGEAVYCADNGVTTFYVCHNDVPAILRPSTDYIHNFWVPYELEQNDDPALIDYWSDSIIYPENSIVKESINGRIFYYRFNGNPASQTLHPSTAYSYWHSMPEGYSAMKASRFAEIVGNGNNRWDCDRSNARLLDWDGNEYLAGTLYVRSNSYGEGGVEVVTKEDKATDSTLGLVKVGDGAQYGVTMLSDGTLRTLQAYNAQIKEGTNAYRPIVPEKQDVTVFYGFAKLAGVDLKNSNTPVGTYPQEAKTAIQNMLGIESDIPLVEEISSSTPSITGMPNVRYNCGTCSLLTITPPAAGSIVVRFHSGSTATVLTVPNTVKFPAWFDYTSLDADTTYEIIITDEVYGGIMSWAD